MPLDLLLKDGNLVLEGRVVKRSIGIKGGKIRGIYSNSQSLQAGEIVDCTDLFILPGMIDIHVHLRDLQQTKKEDFATGTKAAAAGGVTTVVDMPNSIPPVLDYSVLRDKMDSAKEKRYVNVGFYAGVPQDFRIDQIMVPDILGLKVYPHSPLSDVQYTPKRIRQSLQMAKTIDRPLLFHPDVANEGKPPGTIDAFFETHSCDVEKRSVEMFLRELQVIGGHLHICHISCARVVSLLDQARRKVRITGEVTPHHLFLDSNDFDYEDGTAKMLPPLRTKQDSKALISALNVGTIDCVGSDHAPHTIKEKHSSFMKAPSGIPGLETTVPLLLTEVFKNQMSWKTYLRACCQRPAEIIGLTNKGRVAQGFDADLVVISKEPYKIKGSKFYSKAKVTPFEGREVTARPIITIVEGIIVYKDGEFEVDAGSVGAVPVRKH